MRIPQYWSRAETVISADDGAELLVCSWGWSDESEQDAAERAEAALPDAVDRTRRAVSGDHQGDYYLVAPPREEVVARVPQDAETPDAVITRNSYGSAVLNTQSLMFVDIDLPPAPTRPRKPPALLAWFLGLFGIRFPDPSERPDDLAHIRAWASEHPEYGLRIYRTAAGFRVAIVNRDIDPRSDEARRILAELGSDALYRRLCETQNCFRARLSPKPYRIGAFNAPGKHPRTEDYMQTEFERWLGNYDRKSEKYAVCELIEAVGPAASDTQATLLALHDRLSRAESGLPLA